MDFFFRTNQQNMKSDMKSNEMWNFEETKGQNSDKIRILNRTSVRKKHEAKTVKAI